MILKQKKRVFGTKYVGTQQLLVYTVSVQVANNWTESHSVKAVCSLGVEYIYWIEFILFIFNYYYYY